MARGGVLDSPEAQAGFGPIPRVWPVISRLRVVQSYGSGADGVHQCPITERIDGLSVTRPPPIYYLVRWQRYDMNRQGTERTIGHEEFDPRGTLALIGLYFLVLSLMWLFTYFIEFVGNAPTVMGTLQPLALAGLATITTSEYRFQP